MGVSTVLIVGTIVSLLTGKTDLKTLDPELISPVMRWVLPGEAQRYAGSAIRRARHTHIVETEKIVEQIQISTVDAVVKYSNKVNCGVTKYVFNLGVFCAKWITSPTLVLILF